MVERLFEGSHSVHRFVQALVYTKILHLAIVASPVLPNKQESQEDAG